MGKVGLGHKTQTLGQWHSEKEKKKEEEGSTVLYMLNG